MSSRRALAGSLVALLLPASLLLSIETGSALGDTSTAATTAPTTSVLKAGSQRIALEVLPQIVQQGRSTASADQAKAAITATIKPVKVGRKASLEQLSGTTWKTVAKATQDRSGRVNFAASISNGGEALTYRVVAAKSKGLAALTSDSVDTSAWLTAAFTDEFSGSTLGTAWSMRGQDYESKSLRKCSKGSAKAVKVTGGTLRLSVMKDKSAKGKCKVGKASKGKKGKKPKKAPKYAYRLNGHVGTKDMFSFKYGVAAARIKMHKSRGQHASFWMQPLDENHPGSDGNEIDIIEYFGDKHPQGGLTSFIHWYKGKRGIMTGSWIKNPTSFLKNKGDGWSKSYHVFSVQWTPKVLIFRIDGKETWRTSARVSSAQQYLILSLLSSDYELEQTTDKKIPQHMNVDWVRAWETAPTA